MCNFQMCKWGKEKKISQHKTGTEKKLKKDYGK